MKPKDIDKEITSKLGLPSFIEETLERKTAKITIGIRQVKHRKKVTFIKGLEEDIEELKSLAKELKKRLACGGTIEKTEDGYEIILQGDHRKKVAEILEEKGYENIEVI